MVTAGIFDLQHFHELQALSPFRILKQWNYFLCCMPLHPVQSWTCFFFFFLSGREKEEGSLIHSCEENSKEEEEGRPGIPEKEKRVASVAASQEIVAE